MNKILDLWVKMTSIGIYDDLKQDEKSKVRLINQLAVISFCTAILTLGFRIITQSGSTLQNLAIFSFVTMVLVFHKYRYYSISRVLTCFSIPIVFTFLTFHGKGNWGAFNIYILCVLIAVIQYEGKPAKRTMSILLITILGTISIYNLNALGDAMQNHPLENSIVFICYVLVFAFMINIYLQEIKKIGKENIVLVDKLQLRNEELKKFAYITSHDLKEPVRNIGSFAGLLIKKSSEEDASYKILNEIESSAMRMTSLIDSILKYSEIDQTELPMQVVDLNEVINEFEQSHKQLIKESNAIIKRDDLPKINGNNVFMSLLFQNLISNSIKYNRSDKPLIEINSKKLEGFVQIEFMDNGIGIKKEYLDYIFQPFQRLHGQAKFKGSGLGLSICKKIIDLHDGQIWAESDGSNGSKFIVKLPVNKTENN